MGKMQPRTIRALAAALALPTLALVAASATGATGSGGAPAPPVGVTATAGADAATVSFGGASGATGATGSSPAPAGSYFVTTQPGGKLTYGAGSPITVGGLQANVGYTFTVTASSRAGTGAPSARTAPVTTLAPPAGSAPPVLSALKVSLISFFAATSGGPTSAGHGSGTDISYSDSVAASVTVSVVRATPGFKHGTACLTHAAAGRHCTSFFLVGSFSHQDTAGPNKIHFSGRMNGHALAGGVYQLRLSATANGLTSATVKVPIDVF
ncbi:MAG: fibronectin type III domain-containing protein [Solirubrobacteraceae bacterium]|jgi:hypothetical protein